MDFTRQYDVVVAGGGVAGVAAALQAARAGLRTALVEKMVLCGGLATAGLINIYLQLCDGHGHQVIYGIAEEMMRLSLRYGPGEMPAAWQTDGMARDGVRYRTTFMPAALALALDEALEDAGVTLWLDTLACLPVREGTRVAGVVVENKSGRGTLRASCVVDATGDADIAHRAGAPCVEESNWLSCWALQAAATDAPQMQQPLGRIPAVGMVLLGADANGKRMPPDMDKLLGTDAEQVTRYALESRRLLRAYYREQYASGAFDRQTLYPLALPTMAQFRTTRRIVGRETVRDGAANLHQPTSIGLAPDWRKGEDVWEIPYGALLPQSVAGLLVAGRSISSERDAWEVTRVIPPAALTGQVAGLAAALAIQRGTTPDQLAAEDVQRALAAAGLPCHRRDILSA